MKVKLQDGYRSVYTLDDIKRAKSVIHEMQECTESVEKAAGAAISIYLDKHGYNTFNSVEVLTANAVTATDCRRMNYNRFTGNSEKMCVWIDARAEFTAYAGDKIKFGFIKIGFYLSDYWDEFEDESQVCRWIYWQE